MQVTRVTTITTSGGLSLSPMGIFLAIMLGVFLAFALDPPQNAADWEKQHASCMKSELKRASPCRALKRCEKSTGQRYPGRRIKYCPHLKE